MKGYNKESDIIQEIKIKKKRKIFQKWKESVSELKKENYLRDKQNQELVDTFRNIILTSKVFIAIKKLRLMKGKKRNRT